MGLHAGRTADGLRLTVEGRRVRVLGNDERRTTNEGTTRGRTRGATRSLAHGPSRGLIHGRISGLTNDPTHGSTHGPAHVGLRVGLAISANDVHRDFVHRSTCGHRNLTLHGRHHGIVHGTAHLGLNPGLHGIHHGIMRVRGDHLPHDVGADPTAVPSAVLGAGVVSPQPSHL